jgi:hypothetical protein
MRNVVSHFADRTQTQSVGEESGLVGDSWNYQNREGSKVVAFNFCSPLHILKMFEPRRMKRAENVARKEYVSNIYFFSFTLHMSPFLYLLLTDTEDLHEGRYIGLTCRYKRVTLTELKAVLELIIQLTIKLLGIIHRFVFQ